jgi:hypothetical protein
MGSGKQGATLKQVVDAFKKEGIDFSSIVGKTLNVGGSAPAPAKPASLKPIKNPLVSSTTKTR